MASHKVLKSISHNFSHSFISLTNYVGNDYFLGHLLKRVHKTNLNKIEIDVLNGSASPQELLTESMRFSIDNHKNWFSSLVVDSCSSMTFIVKATLTITFDIKRIDSQEFKNRVLPSPFECVMIITDDKGREYKSVHSDWWFPET